MKMSFTTETETDHSVLLAEAHIQNEEQFIRLNHKANMEYMQYFRVNPKRPFHLSINGKMIDDYTTAKLFLAAEGDNIMSNANIITRVLANHT